ncbi:MAG: hypothetical protein M1587_00060 [Thaumarchaeota archaeon]|nr:hypothetical protein [Nitrososphaerota archaeon]
MRKAILCDNESSRALSNTHDEELWNALETLISLLCAESKFVQIEILQAWKAPHHNVGARELYSWRAAIEEIKNSDLQSKCSEKKSDQQYSSMIDKPAMLKMAGEITNSLMHSYSSGHRITFA